MKDFENSVTTQAVEGGYGAISAAFLQSTVGQMIPWLIAMLAVVLCDLAFGLRKSMLLNESVRFSSAMRRTLGKIVVYFSFVMAMVTIDLASGSRYGIADYACLLVCFIEFCSILSNILAPKGIKFNRIKALTLFVGHHAHLDKEEKEELKEIMESETNTNER